MPNSADLKFPLCVDLDGTLIKSDVLLESIILLLKKNLLFAFAMLYWFYKGGKAYFKKQIALRVQPDPQYLPYNQKVLAFLHKQRELGRQLVLATAADEILAYQVADYLGIFDDVVASNATASLSGKKKAAALIAKFGEHGFDYAGNSSVDLPVWQAANAIIIVTNSQYLLRQAKQLNRHIALHTEARLPLTQTLTKALRSHQWAKNLLVFLPLLLAYQIHLLGIVQATIAFLSFCAAASTIYLINDLLDLESDRVHPNKQQRPLANGELAIQLSMCLIPVLLLMSIVLGLLLPALFMQVLLGYMILSTIYSLYLKHMLCADVILLSMLYTLRVIAGGTATNVTVSMWLLACISFLFLSLALMKRVIHLVLAQPTSLDHNTSPYQTEDLQQLASFGAASGYITILIFILYINSDAVNLVHQYPGWLWLACPLLLYWIQRAWLLARRGNIQFDPVLFTLHDKVSYIIAGLLLLILFLAH